MAERKGRKPAAAQQIELWQNVPLPQAQARRRPDTPFKPASQQVPPATASLPVQRTEEGETLQTTEFDVRPLVTLVNVYAMTKRQRAEYIIPTPLNIVAVREDIPRKEIWYRASIITERDSETGRQMQVEWFGDRTRNIEEAYDLIEVVVRERGLTLESLQPVEVPTPKTKADPQLTSSAVDLPAPRTKKAAALQTEFLAAHQQATTDVSKVQTAKRKQVKLESFEHYEQSLHREEARLQELEVRGAEALSEYDIKIAAGGDAALALQTALQLVRNHIAYDKSHMEQVRPAATQPSLTTLRGHAEEVTAADPAYSHPSPEITEPLRSLVTIVKLWQLTERQKAELVIPTPLCILASKDSEKRIQYKAGMITERNPVTAKQQALVAFGEKTQDLEEAYRMIDEGVRERKLDRVGLQPIVVPAKPEPEPTPTAEQLERNPLLAILKEDEIYVDPNEVTIEEAEENAYPLLRRDVVTYRWWLEFPFDTREQPELNQALKDTKWRWGGYRQQWHNVSHFPDMPKDMQYANAGPAFYSEENAERIEARATKARDECSTPTGNHRRE